MGFAPQSPMARTMITATRFSFGILGCVVAMHATSQTIQISPSTPRALDTIRVRAPEIFNDASSANQTAYNTINGRLTTTTMSGNKVTINVVVSKSDFALRPSAVIDMPIGQFPAGTYHVEVVRSEPDGNSFGVVGSSTFVVQPRISSDPIWSHSDLWWDPEESGWGLNVMHHGLGRIFATWFVYGSERKATWYVVSDGSWVTPLEYRGIVYRTSGPDVAECTTVSCSRPFDPSLVTRDAVGTMTLSFHPTVATSASVSFTIDGKTINKSLQRQPF